MFCESLGILKSLEYLANQIIEELSDKNEYILKTKYLEHYITLRCVVDPKLKGKIKEIKPNALLLSSSGDFKYTIIMKYLSYANLLHELKHMDRDIRRDKQIGYGQLLNYVGTQTSSDYKYLIKNGIPKIEFSKYGVDVSFELLSYTLISILHYADQNEFESHFASAYYDLKDKITPDMSKVDKKKIIDGYLNDCGLFDFYKFYYKNGFDLSKFFKNNKDVNYFIDKMIKNINNIINGIDIGKTININKKEILKNKVKRMFSFFEEDDKDIKSEVRKVNFYINKSIQRNYKKIYRLYSLFI